MLDHLDQLLHLGLIRKKVGWRRRANILSVEVYAPNMYVVTFDRTVTVTTNPPTGGYVQINDEDPTDATAANDTQIILTMPSADGGGYGWNVNNGAWTTPSCNETSGIVPS